MCKYCEENVEFSSSNFCGSAKAQVAGTKAFGRIHFKSLEDAQYIIDNFKEELFKYWL